MNILQAIGSNIGKVINQGPPPANIFEAAQKGNVGAFKQFAQGQDINGYDQEGWAAVHYASWEGQLGILQEIQQLGGELQLKDQAGRSCVHLSSYQGHEQMLGWLCSLKLDLNQRDVSGFTPLHHAVAQGRPKSVGQLVPSGADLYAVTPDGMAPMHLAAWKGQKAAAEKLLELGLDVNIRSRHQSVALHEATLGGHEEMVTWLISKGAEAGLKDAYGYLPEDLAYTKQLWRIYAILQAARQGLPPPSFQSNTAVQAVPMSSTSIDEPEAPSAPSATSPPQTTEQQNEYEDYLATQAPVPQTIFRMTATTTDDTSSVSYPAVSSFEAPPLPATSAQSTPAQPTPAQTPAPAAPVTTVTPGASAPSPKVEDSTAAPAAAGASVVMSGATTGATAAAAGGGGASGGVVYDDDEYDDMAAEPKVGKTKAGEEQQLPFGGWGQQDASNWGQKPFEVVKVDPKVAAAIEEYRRVLTPEEATKYLQYYDAMQSRQQGWLRKQDYGQHVAAMQLAAAGVQAREQRGRGRRTGIIAKNAAQEAGAQLMSALQHRVQQFVGSKASSLPCPEFSEQNIKSATAGYSPSRIVGKGGYGPVYKGRLNHTDVAIKVLDPPSSQGARQFQQEVSILSRVHHPHVLLLIGACPAAHALVYEYLPGGSLQDRLHPSPTTEPLPWTARVRIALEMATALLFLHSMKPDQVLHRDLKPANVLLDSAGRAKLGDVGLSRLVPTNNPTAMSTVECSSTVGTAAYVDPEYVRTGEYGTASDVYSFGVTLMQLMTASDPQGVIQLMTNALSRGNLKSVIDPKAGAWPQQDAAEFANLALKCVEYDRKRRPGLALEIVPRLQALSTRAQSAVADPKAEEPPELFICPITQEVMVEPVIAADGYTYERSAISMWLDRGHKSSPMTNTKLNKTELTPNFALRSAILEWVDEHKAQPAPAPRAYQTA